MEALERVLQEATASSDAKLQKCSVPISISFENSTLSKKPVAKIAAAATDDDAFAFPKIEWNDDVVEEEKDTFLKHRP